MKFFRILGYILFDHKRNKEILEGLKVEPVDEKLRRYKSNWHHVTTMNSNRMTKTIHNYRPNGRRRLGGASKRLLAEAETGLSRSNSWWMMTMIIIMTNVLSAPVYTVSKRWHPETRGSAYETLRTPISGATAGRNMIAGLYAHNMQSNNNGKNTTRWGDP